MVMYMLKTALKGSSLHYHNCIQRIITLKPARKFQKTCNKISNKIIKKTWPLDMVHKIYCNITFKY